MTARESDIKRDVLVLACDFLRLILKIIVLFVFFLCRFSQLSDLMHFT